MYLIIFILLVLAFIILLMFYVPAFIKAKIDTDINDYDVMIYWLSPIFKAKVEIENFAPHLSIYLFDKRVYKKAVKPQKGQKKFSVSDYYQALELSNSYVNARYGLDSPFATGIASSIVGIIGSYFKNVFVTQSPDFLPFNDYILINAGTQLNVGKSAVNLVKIYADNKNSRRNDEYGTVRYG
ncbi:MAG TPA: hypothetical protein VHO66_09720 [Ruminiclostridium sp.]|nr:hypothetical protein [Ruminiclostridium sp.]